MADTPFHNPFAALKPVRDAMPDPPASAEADTPAVAPQSPVATRIPRAVVRIERSGRGGKEVTVVEHLGLSADELGVWAKAFKGTLGCGGQVEEGAIVLHGDHRKRLPALLTARGVRKVVVG